MNGSGSGPNHSGQSQPLFYDGTLYVSTGENDIFAIDVETGAHKWSYEANLDPARVQVCCGWVNRGLAMGDGQIYMGQLDSQLVAIDQATGKVNWIIQAEDPLLGYSITAAPLYYNGLVIMGFAGGERAVRGRIKGYDAKTGELKWTFYTIPGPGEFGHDTWPQDNNAWEVGGAPIWQTPAVDPDDHHLFISLGCAAENFAQASGATGRPGRLGFDAAMALRAQVRQQFHNALALIFRAGRAVAETGRRLRAVAKQQIGEARGCHAQLGAHAFAPFVLDGGAAVGAQDIHAR
jgi:glucose dehydrogenase